MMTRVKPSSRAKVQLLANQLADGHKGEVVEEITDFASEIVNGKASPEQVRELMAFFVKLGEKAWPIILKENADVGYAVRKAAKELGEEKKS